MSHPHAAPSSLLLCVARAKNVAEHGPQCARGPGHASWAWWRAGGGWTLRLGTLATPLSDLLCSSWPVQVGRRALHPAARGLSAGLEMPHALQAVGRRPLADGSGLVVGGGCARWLRPSHGFALSSCSLARLFYFWQGALRCGPVGQPFRQQAARIYTQLGGEEC